MLALNNEVPELRSNSYTRYSGLLQLEYFEI